MAFAVRVPDLGQRPMHTDESINAYITGDLLAGKPYQYDPKDRHGPVLYALALPVAKLAGVKNFSEMTEVSVRLGPVIVGALTILLFGLLVDVIGFPAAVGGAVLLAISPLAIYYNRDFIHETLFAAATLATLIFGFRWLEKKSLKHGILTGVGAGLMLACKETAVIHFVAFGITVAWWFWASRSKEQSSDRRLFVKPAVAAVISFGVVTVLLFTWGGRHWEGLADLFHAAPHLASRAGGEGHQKPAWYYLVLLGGGWSGAAVLALAICGACNCKGEAVSKKAFRIWVVYTIAIFILYSLIPYKTPWLALNFFLPLAVLAGNGLVQLWRLARKPALRIVVVVFAAGFCAALGHDTWQRVFVAPAGERNPYAYAQTVDDILRLPERVARLAANNPSGKNLRIAVVAADPWPLPWYLRQFPNVGFWQPGQNPGNADIFITSSDVSDELQERLKDWRPEFFGVRAEVLMVLWQPPKGEAAHE